MIRVALITGSTSEIGLATAQRLHREGMTVVVNSNDPEHERVVAEFDDPSRVQFYVADVRDETALVAMRDHIESNLGRLDYLVANAGVHTMPSGNDQISQVHSTCTDTVIDINLKGTISTLRIFGPLIQKTSQAGAIVTLSSVDGLIGEPYDVIYSATKAGVVSFTQSFARLLRDPLVRVNAVAPGLVDTPLTTAIDVDPTETTDVSVIQRMGTADEIASAIAFLLSEDASYVTGQVLVVDGGFTLK